MGKSTGVALRHSGNSWDGKKHGVRVLYGRTAAICVIALPALAACAKNTVPVSVHGVNYAADEFSYVIEDPANKKNTAGGETVGPFAAGAVAGISEGTMGHWY